MQILGTIFFESDFIKNVLHIAILFLPSFLRNSQRNLQMVPFLPRTKLVGCYGVSLEYPPRVHMLEAVTTGRCCTLREEVRPLGVPLRGHMDLTFAPSLASWLPMRGAASPTHTPSTVGCAAQDQGNCAKCPALRACETMRPNNPIILVSYLRCSATVLG